MDVRVLKKSDNLFKTYYEIKKTKKPASFELFVQKNTDEVFDANLKFGDHECQGIINLKDSSNKEVVWQELMAAEISSKSRYGLIDDVWSAIQTTIEKINESDFSEMSEAEKKIDESEKITIDELIQRVAKEMIEDYHIKTASDTEEIFLFKNNHYQQPQGYIKKIISERLDMYKEHWHPRLILEIIKVIQSRTMVDREIFNSNHDFIPCKNGYLEIKTGKLHPPNPHYVYTWQLPVNFDKDAQCPKAEKVLLQILGENFTKTFWEFAGYCLYNNTIKKSALVLYGTHNTGKTTAANVLRTFLGDKNVVSNELKNLSEDRWAPATLFGKLCNIATEMSPRAIKDDTMFKAITDGNPIMAEKKGMQPFMFTPTCKLMFACNKLPPVTNASSAFYERLNLIECINEFPSNSDTAVKNGDWISETEKSGMLNHAIAGLTIIRNNKKFSHVKSMDDTRMEYLKQSDPVDFFIKNAIDYDPLATSKTNQEIYDYYIDFCKFHKFEPVSYQSFVSPRGVWKRNFGSSEFSGKKGNLSTTKFVKFSWDKNKTQPEQNPSPVLLPNKPPKSSPYDKIKIIEEEEHEKDWLDQFSEEFLRKQYEISQMSSEDYMETLIEDEKFKEDQNMREMIEELGSIEAYNVWLKENEKDEDKS
jgi:putative DNA primase/helicase